MELNVVYPTPALSNHSHGNPTLSLAGGLSGATASNSDGFTLSLTQASAAPSPINVSAGSTTTAASGLTFSNSNNVSFGLGTGASAGVLTASFSVTEPFLTTAAQSNHSHGNPTLNLTNLSGTTGSNSNGLTLSLSAGKEETLSYFANSPIFINTQTWNQIASHCLIPLVIQAPLSFDYIRLFESGSISAASTTAATVATSATNAVAELYLLRNLYMGIYSRVSGSQLSRYYTTFRNIGYQGYLNKSTFTAGSQNYFSYTIGYPTATGETGITTTFTTAQTNLPFHSSFMTGITGVKEVDYKFGTTLSPGVWWLYLGYLTNTNLVSGRTEQFRNSVNFSGIGISQHTLPVGKMNGATNSSVAPQQGGWIGTNTPQASYNITDIKTIASNVIPYFQLMVT